MRLGRVGQLQRDVPLRQPLAQPAELDLDDLLQMLLGQRVEDDDLVDAVEELRAGSACRISSSTASFMRS